MKFYVSYRLSRLYVTHEVWVEVKDGNFFSAETRDIEFEKGKQ